jgi:hypothetical protein
MMPAVSGEFEASPWDEILNWGRCVKIASVDDIGAVRLLVDAPGSDRRAVVFEWQTNTERQALIDELGAEGLALRSFDDADRAASSFRLAGIERLLMLPGLPYVLIMRLRGRMTGMYEVTTHESGPPPTANR